MIGVVGVFVIHDDVVRPDEPPVAAQHVEFALPPSRKRILRHHEIGGGRVGRPRAGPERDVVGGVGAADRREIVRQRLDELLLAERIGPRRFLLGRAARHFLDDPDPIFLRAPRLQRPLQRVTIAALGKQNLLLVRAREARDNF